MKIKTYKERLQLVLPERASDGVTSDMGPGPFCFDK